MNDVIDMFGACEAEKCKRLDRKIMSKEDLVIVDKKKYHRGCQPTKEEQKAKNRSYS